MIRRRRHAPPSHHVLLLAAVTAGLVVSMAPAALTQAAQSDLSITKASDPAGAVEPGDEITYTIAVTNAGPDAATGVTITDATPANTTYVAGSATIQEGAGPAAPVADAPAAGDNPFEAGYTHPNPLASGETLIAEYRVTVDAGTANGTEIENTAEVYATNDPNATQANPLESNVVTNTVAAADLTIDKTADPAAGPVTPGDTITYTITVTNAGAAPAENVVVTDPTPANTTFVPNSATENGDPIASGTNPFETGYTLTDPDPNLDPGETAVLTFQVVVTRPLESGTAITNTATVRSDQTPAVSDSTTHTAASAPELSISKNASPAEGTQIIPGSEITYSIVVTNSATATEVADELVLIDPTPTDTTFVAGSATLNGTTVAGGENPFSLGFALPDLNPGASHTVTFRVRVDRPLPDGTVISNLARVTEADHAPVQDGASHTVDATAALELSGSSTFPRPGSQVQEGDRIRYLFQVSNDPAATASLTGVSFTAQTPKGTKYVDNSAKVDGAAIPDASNPFAVGVALGTIEPGVTRTVQFDVIVGDAAGDRIQANATVAAQNHGPITTTVTHRVADDDRTGGGGGGGGGNEQGGGGGGGGQDTGGSGGGDGGGTGGDLAFTGIDLARLLVLAFSLLLAGTVLLGQGRRVQRRTTTGQVVNQERVADMPEPRFQWDGFWAFPPKRR